MAQKQDNGNHAATPGPWKLRPPVECDNPHIEFWVDAGEGVPIADIKVNANTEANARLIAAAPELLEALEVITTLVEDIIIHGEVGPYSGDKPRITKARAALAKARKED